MSSKKNIIKNRVLWASVFFFVSLLLIMKLQTNLNLLIIFIAIIISALFFLFNYPLKNKK
ncbi:hypothetical protein T479_06735 [Lysinibacillus varians]|nr:hypothetical protein T479_06735 [Lysinibacillus varians]